MSKSNRTGGFLGNLGRTVKGHLRRSAEFFPNSALGARVNTFATVTKVLRYLRYSFKVF